MAYNTQGRQKEKGKWRGETETPVDLKYFCLGFSPFCFYHLLLFFVFYLLPFAFADVRMMRERILEFIYQQIREVRER
jgi:hypothetical protein